MSETKHDEIRQAVIEPVFAEEESLAPDVATTISINPGDPFAGGGPARHSGMTGRKTGIDTYGEYARHSGAALSGKDPSRIDRVGAYAARNAAKSVVAAGLAGECEVQVSYAIGLSAPVSVQVATFGSGRQPDAEIAARVRRCFDFRPAAVVARFDLRHRPQQHGGRFYRTLAAYGHMGRVDIETPWESTGGAAALTD